MKPFPTKPATKSPTSTRATAPSSTASAKAGAARKSPSTSASASTPSAATPKSFSNTSPSTPKPNLSPASPRATAATAEIQKPDRFSLNPCIQWFEILPSLKSPPDSALLFYVFSRIFAAEILPSEISPPRIDQVLRTRIFEPQKGKKQPEKVRTPDLGRGLVELTMIPI